MAASIIPAAGDTGEIQLMSDFASNLQDVAETAAEVLTAWVDDDLRLVEDEDSPDFNGAVAKLATKLPEVLALLTEIKDLADEAADRLRRRSAREDRADRAYHQMQSL